MTFSDIKKETNPVMNGVQNEVNLSQFFRTIDLYSLLLWGNDTLGVMTFSDIKKDIHPIQTRQNGIARV